MDQIGARELRHRLREYLARADGGERFEVTLFGRPVAYLGPPSTDRTVFARLVEAGKVTPARNPDTTALPSTVPTKTGVSATDSLLDERRSDAR
jgi:antitoxin (DNA-binding transcriptional repressor) of toxin-antitoxin stability system